MYAYQDSRRLRKLFYRPIEAAIRWCNLMEYETQILEFDWGQSVLLSISPLQWQRLQANTEKIFDAVRNHELPYGMLGVTMTPGAVVDQRLLTVRHTDLKWWILHNYPDQRPAFLFGDITTEDEKIKLGTYLALKADRDSLRAQLKASEFAYRELIEELKAINIDRENLKILARAKRPPSERSEVGYLRVIGALLETILGVSPSGKPNSVFNSQASIVDSITVNYEGVYGLGKRSLDEKFAAARRSFARD